MLRYYISLFFLMCSPIILATNNNDSIIKYGIRAGTDLQKIVKSFTTTNFKGFSISGDIRFKKSLFLNSEIGKEEKIINTYYLNTSVKGNYIKVGLKNKLNKEQNSENIFYSGFNLGYSIFSQKINNYVIYNTNSSIWGESEINSPININNLNALWFEFLIGVKTEIFNNFFLSIELQLKNILKQNNKQGITNLYIPGFNRTYDSSNLGAGFSYSISYLIPLVKK